MMDSLNRFDRSDLEIPYRQFRMSKEFVPLPLATVLCNLDVSKHVASKVKLLDLCHIFKRQAGKRLIMKVIILSIAVGISMCSEISCYGAKGYARPFTFNCSLRGRESFKTSKLHHQPFLN